VVISYNAATDLVCPAAAISSEDLTFTG
jgi:hypothetical protein